MQKKITLRLTPAEANTEAAMYQHIANSEAVSVNSITGFHKLKQSIDARSRKQVWLNVTLRAFIDEPFCNRAQPIFNFNDTTNAKRKVIIVGAGPAGLFAALKLLQHNIQPIIIERGRNVRHRRHDIARLNREGILNENSNYCFGEGGAGAYSDGKLYTRSTKRGKVEDILHLFVNMGADEKILYEAHPHIGTNKLPHVISNMRQTIEGYGGKYLFETQLANFIIKDNIIKGITTATGNTLYADAVILATGHAARDVFEMLHKKNILITSKPFALGVRIEHPQTLIDELQYHEAVRNTYLPPASYSWVEQVGNRGVFSFCMCPGGIIAPAATTQKEIVVNGWSPSKRNNFFANSGIVVQVNQADAVNYFRKQKYTNNNTTANSPLLLLAFQQAIEQQAYTLGGGNFVAPAQRMVDFCNNKNSETLPQCSYHPGVRAVTLEKVLPDFICTSLQQAFMRMNKKMKIYYTNEALLVGVESRTSSPVRIPRNEGSLQHPQIKNLYPCGEGAGYAGGIVSAAMDGEAVANSIAQTFTCC